MNDPVTLVMEGDARELAAPWSRLLEFSIGRGWTARVDAFSDYDTSLPPAAAQAIQELRSRTDTGMAVPLDVDDPADRELADAFGPYAIHATVGPGNREVFGVHDGTSLWFSVTQEDLSTLREAFAADGVDLDAKFDVATAPRTWPQAVLLLVAVLVVVLIGWLILG